MQNINFPKVGVADVLKYFWRAMRVRKWSFYFMLLAFNIGSIGLVLVPLFYKKFFDILGTTTNKAVMMGDLTEIIVWVLIIHGVVWIFHQAGFLVMNNFVAKTMASLRQTAFNYTIKHSYSFFANSFSGGLVQRVNRFVRAFDVLHDTLFFNIIPLLVHVVGVIIIIYAQEPLISYLIVGWTLVMIIFNYFFYRWKVKYDISAAKADSGTTALLADNLTNQNTISTFAGFDRESQSFKEVTFDQARKQKLSWDIGVTKDGIQIGFIFVMEFLLFYYAIKFWGQGLITVGTFVLIQVYIIALAQRLWDFGRIIRHTYEGFADSKEMVEILELPYEIKDIPNAKELEVTAGKIEFQNVSFAFNQTRNVLEKINLTVNAGEKVALIGPSGAGKSTFVRLLLRMYDVAEGEIKIDNQNIKDVSQNSLREKVSLVPQDPILFHRTLMENIRYGREDATDEEVVEASRLAHCDEFIDVLPEKYNTYVGERGIKLSGGERQRVAIARAILKNAPILVLDEATSSLDSHSESLIQDALDKLMENKTVIVIAHRLSTIRKMDRVIAIDNGQVVEEGSHEELLAREHSLYKNLWNLQAGGFLPE